jgi:hypothetical protein
MRHGREILVRLFLGLLVLAGSTGATYYVPATQLESSEVRGVHNKNRVEGGILSGTVLSDPTPSFARDEDGELLSPTLSRAYLMPFVGMEFSLSELEELGARIQPFSALELRYKRQFYGLDEAKTVRKNISISGAVAGGMTLGAPPRATYITTTPEEVASGSSLLYYFKLSVPGGYRIHEQHLLLLTPHFTFGGLVNAGSLNGTALQFGISTGWQYDIASLFVRAETGYARGSFLGGVASFFPFAASAGLRF